VDVAVFVVDARAGVGAGDARVAADLSSTGRPVLCAVNKIDAVRNSRVVEALSKASELGRFEEFVPVSGRSGEGVGLLAELVAARLPEGPMYYEEGTTTDQPPPLFVAEVVREKLLEKTREELPHSIAVVTEDFEERADGLLEIRTTVFVERESQKGMVVGRGGRLVKEAGTEAREEVELLFGRKVFLELRVKVEKDWQRRAPALQRLGLAG
jgi:GTPase